MKCDRLWWIGIKPYDLFGVEHLFEGAISIIGSKETLSIQLITLEDKCKKRLNHNAQQNFIEIDKFFKDEISKLLKKDPTIRFFWHDQNNFSEDDFFFKTSKYNNSKSLLALLSNKLIIRSIINRHLPVIPHIQLLTIECNYRFLHKCFPKSKSYVIQSSISAGGDGTIVLSSPEDDKLIDGLNTQYVTASEYYSNALPINQHLIITSEEVYCLPLSIQIVEENALHRLIYKGGDFSSAATISEQKRIQIQASGYKLGKLLSMAGYRGCIGIDYLINNNHIWFIELNPRFQSSTRLLNENLITNGCPSLYELHMKAFDEETISIPDSLKTEGAFYLSNFAEITENLKSDQKKLYSPDPRETAFSKDQIGVIVETNGLQKDTFIEPDAHGMMINVDRGILSYSSKTGVVLNHSVINYGKKRPKFISDVKNNNIHACARLKFDLFSYGMQMGKSALQRLSKDRDDLTIRDGIAGGLELSFNNTIHVNTPIKEFFALISPYILEFDFSENSYFLRDQYGDTLHVNIIPIPDFVGLTTSRGTPMVEVGQMHNERLSLEVVFGCKNNLKRDTACHFCELGAEPEIKYTSLEDIQELVAYCENSESINMRHILIGGGTPPENKWHIFFKTLDAVKRITGVPTYMMIAPPKDLNRLTELKRMGLNEIGFNMELFNRNIAKEIMPEKGKIPKSYYLKTMDIAVTLWGGAGNVRSVMIVGLEPLEQTLKGVELLAAHGVMPILSPFRPIPGTKMASHPPAHSELLYEAWCRGEEIVSKYGLTLGPTCIACQNNTVALPFNPICHYY